jgi:hypothetical protein
MADTVGLTMEELDGLQIMIRIAERRPHAARLGRNEGRPAATPRSMAS